MRSVKSCDLSPLSSPTCAEVGESRGFFVEILLAASAFCFFVVSSAQSCKL